jgi:hypothetical protein
VNVTGGAGWASIRLLRLLLCAFGRDGQRRENVGVLKIECRFVHVQKGCHILSLSDFLFQRLPGCRRETARDVKTAGREGGKEGEEKRGEDRREEIVLSTKGGAFISPQPRRHCNCGICCVKRPTQRPGRRYFQKASGTNAFIDRYSALADKCLFIACGKHEQ